MIDSEFERKGRAMSDLGYHNYFASEELAEYGKWLDTLPDDAKETIKEQAQRIAELERDNANQANLLDALRETIGQMSHEANTQHAAALDLQAQRDAANKRAEQAEADARALAKLLKEVDDANPHMAYSAKAYWVIRKYLNSERA